jgi:predicted RNA-binding Zn ribbon-like protein
MSGERQPGGHPPAPGRLALLQAFLNTHYDLAAGGGEVFDGADMTRRWLVERRLVASSAAVSDADVRRMLSVRETLRDLVAGREVSRELTALRPIVEIRLAPDQPRLEPVKTGTIDGAIATLLAIVATEMLTDRWSRLKVCPGEHCGWAFYDNSRNRSGRWCSMDVCGGRSKARAYYRRRRDE